MAAIEQAVATCELHRDWTHDELVSCVAVLGEDTVAAYLNSAGIRVTNDAYTGYAVAPVTVNNDTDWTDTRLLSVVQYILKTG